MQKKNINALLQLLKGGIKMNLKNIAAICLLSVLLLNAVAITPVEAKTSDANDLKSVQEIEETFSGSKEKSVMPDGPIDRDRINH